MVNPFAKIRNFYTEMIGELKKASWPNRIELRDSTIVVILASLMLGTFVSIVDFSLFEVVSLFTDWVHPRR
jgi:preprotein translocase subunit SecE